VNGSASARDLVLHVRLLAASITITASPSCLADGSWIVQMCGWLSDRRAALAPGIDRAPSGLAARQKKKNAKKKEERKKKKAKQKKKVVFRA